jgi:hypothetical protein
MQPIEIEDTQSQLLLCILPRKALTVSQATKALLEPSTFESQLRKTLDKAAIVAPLEGSKAATVAMAEGKQSSDEDAEEDRFADDFDGIDWARLPLLMKPPATQRQRKSWVYRHGYRVTSIKAPASKWFVCKYCHQHKIIDAGGAGLFNVTKATTSAATHLGLNVHGHNLTKQGSKPLKVLAGGQLSVRQAFKRGVEVTQEAANALGNFNVQGFRLAAVLWLVDNNHPLCEVENQHFGY